MPRMNRILRLGAAVLLCSVAAISSLTLGAQAKFDSNEKARAKKMLATIKQSIQTNYYDPTFRGIDLNARFKQTEQQIESATSFGAAYAAIAQTLLEFNDSHL